MDMLHIRVFLRFAEPPRCLNFIVMVATAKTEEAVAMDTANKWPVSVYSQYILPLLLKLLAVATATQLPCGVPYATCCCRCHPIGSYFCRYTTGVCH